jgi:hypothetical protein
MVTNVTTQNLPLEDEETSSEHSVSKYFLEIIQQNTGYKSLHATFLEPCLVLY